MIIAGIYATFAVAQRKPEFYQTFFAQLQKVAYITVMIILHLILYSAAQLYDFHIFITSNLRYSAKLN